MQDKADPTRIKAFRSKNLNNEFLRFVHPAVWAASGHLIGFRFVKSLLTSRPLAAILTAKGRRYGSARLFGETNTDEATKCCSCSRICWMRSACSCGDAPSAAVPERSGQWHFLFHDGRSKWCPCLDREAGSMEWVAHRPYLWRATNAQAGSVDE